MSKPVTPRVYGFRNKGKCTKFLAHSDCDSPRARRDSCVSFETPKCKNCTALSMDNDRLRRQIAVLRSFIDKHSIETDPFAADCFKQDIQEHVPTVNSTETQTPSIVLDSRPPALF